MNQVDLVVFTFLAGFNTLLFAYLVVKISNYLDWKRDWRENNVRR
jgi:hypothetical protein